MQDWPPRTTVSRGFVKDALINGRDKNNDCLYCTVRYVAVLAINGVLIVLYGVLFIYTSMLIHIILCLFFQCQDTLQYSSIRTGIYVLRKTYSRPRDPSTKALLKPCLDRFEALCIKIP